MRSYRIGKTLKIRWTILSGGAPEPLAGRDLTLEISSGNRVRTSLPFVADGNVAEFVFQGSEQRYVGAYMVTMWENRGKENQTVVDRCDAFCLVACSCEERTEDPAETDLDVETLELASSDLETGVPGMSAYELFKRHNPDSQLTEEEYAESPVQAAGAALAAIEQLEETEASVKQSEQIREQAEQGREASEQNRATAEQTRVTAEQQRVLAEQTRVTNEASRQTAEAGRQAAETKREENTAEAIRNSEEATRKAEDEAIRVRTLADNPPKIVEVDGVKYWAFWDEATGQYVPSENRADVGDAVLFSPQVLTPQQQEQARKNIGILSSPSRSFVDLRPIIGTDCWAVYRFDDTGYYILHNGGFTKLSLDFSKIYSVNCPGLYDREPSFNLCCKIGNRVFVSASNVAKLIYMYDEDTDQGSYLENPADLHYYGNIYAIDGKLYRFHSHDSTDIYVYNADGQFVQHVMNEHGRIKYTEGTAFTSDGYKVNLSDFSFEPLSFPIEMGGYFNWVFGNGNILKSINGISSNNNTQAYIFSILPADIAGLAISNSDVYAILYTTYGKLIYTYPYGLSNSTHRQQRIDPPYARLVIRKATIYGDEVYVTTKDNILIIEDIRCYATD